MNKPRLIDANEVIEILEFYETDCDGISWAIRNIKELPAAYDIDKVVEQLEAKFQPVVQGRRNGKTLRYGFDLGIKKAIEIVKGGAE